jgi:hypothetical protein
MKDIKTFITESMSALKLKNVRVIYRVIPDIFTVGVPNNYSESDMQIYLDDKCLDELPGSNDHSKKVLGNNIKQISDCHFEYDKYVASSKPSGEVNLEWDTKYDENNHGDSYTYYKLNNLKYIIEFGEFNLKNVDDTKIKDELTKIFETFNSSKTNQYPIEIELEDIEYAE